MKDFNYYLTSLNSTKIIENTTTENAEQVFKIQKPAVDTFVNINNEIGDCTVCGINGVKITNHVCQTPIDIDKINDFTTHVNNMNERKLEMAEEVFNRNKHLLVNLNSKYPDKSNLMQYTFDILNDITNHEQEPIDQYRHQLYQIIKVYLQEHGYSK